MCWSRKKKKNKTVTASVEPMKDISEEELRWGKELTRYFPATFPMAGAAVTVRPPCDGRGGEMRRKG